VRGELDLLEGAGYAFDHASFIRGEITPTFFGSALTNFGLEPFFDAFVELAPSPSGRMVDLADGTERRLEVTEPFSAFVFKIQANMDPRHRDSVSFIRICSGRYEPDMHVVHERTGEVVRLARPQSIVARERLSIDEAFAGDVVGLIGKDRYHIGDTLSLEGGFQHKPLPLFQPEVFARVAPKSTSDRKRFDKGIKSLIAEGAVRDPLPVEAREAPRRAAEPRPRPARHRLRAAREGAPRGRRFRRAARTLAACRPRPDSRSVPSCWPRWCSPLRPLPRSMHARERSTRCASSC
jgi:peptide chain release factor 3